MRPALCGYCYIPSGPYMVVQENKIYGACCIEHMEKVREGKQLKRIAVACEDGIDYTIKKSKQTYLDIAKSNGSYVMHEWDRKDRELLFSAIVNNYMTWANEQARSGRIERVIQNGSD